MPIVSVSILSNDPLGMNGQRKIRLSITDSDSNVFKKLPEIIDKNFIDEQDKLNYINNYIIRINESLDNDEQFNSIYSDNIVNYVLSPIHSTSKKIAIYLIRLMISTKDIDLIIKLKPFLLYLNSNYTDNQLLSLLDIDQIQLDKIRFRVKNIYSAPSLSMSLENIKNSFDLLSEEF